ncbi:shikimate kinase [Ekhidna sp. To15]|uniref:shikimate kinase n=1 Tax=Ekhidna sp. To15 TaxID=3395267 RepID=UPI003F520BE3
MNQKIFLIGLPGSGKTTMGLDLAVHLGLQFVDLDQDIERDEGLPITEIFEKKGEAHFRQLEKFHLDKIVEELDSFVMATGGGTPCFFNNLETMQQTGITIYLDTPIEKIEERLRLDSTRPLMKVNSLTELLEKRKGWYNQADHTIREYKEILKLF